MALAIETPTMRIIEAGDPAIEAMARVIVDAYPIMNVNSPEAFARFVEQINTMIDEPSTRVVVAERDGVVVGAMRLHDFTMNVRGFDAMTGGVGSVAVSLTHKRQGVARALIAWYLNYYRERDAPFAILHPFRPSFYRSFGFGYGTPVHRFRFAPATLLAGGARGTVRALGEKDLDALLACSERVRASTNGLLVRHRAVTRRALTEMSHRYVGVEDEGGTLRGFMLTSVSLGAKDVTNRNALVVRDLLYEDDTYLAALLGYLRAQQDQFMEIVIESQDAAFYLAAEDPRDRSDRLVSPPGAHRIGETGLGIMYRIIDIERAFGYVPPSSTAFSLHLEVEDAFWPHTRGEYRFRFGPDAPPRRDDAASPDVTLRIGIAELSSVVVGSLRLRDVVRHRLATIEPQAALPAVANALDADTPPICTTRF